MTRGAVRAARAAVGADGRRRGDHRAEAQVEARDHVRPHRVDHGVLRQVEPRDRVGPHVVQEVVPQRQEPSVARGPDLHVVDLVALHAGDQRVLPPRLDPLHRPVEPPRQLGHRDVLGVVHALGAEAPAHVGRRDHPHALLRHAELAGNHPPVAMHHLHGAPHRERIAVPARDEAARLERMRAAARQPHPRLHDHRGAGERGRRVAHLLPPLRHDIAPDLVVHDRRPRGDRPLDVDHRGQRLVLDANQVERIVRPIRIVRHHDRHRLPHESHPIPGQHRDTARNGQRRMGRIDRDRPPDGPQIRRHEDPDHPGRPPRGRARRSRRCAHGHAATATSPRADSPARADHRRTPPPP